MKKGYIRTASKESEEGILKQKELLKEYVDEIYMDEGFSGMDLNRPGFQKLMTSLNPGDTIVVTSIDRIARNNLMLITFFQELKSNNIYFKCINQADNDFNDLEAIIKSAEAKILSNRRK